jgi:hypothetical protein
MKTLSNKTNALIAALLLSCSATQAFANGEHPDRKGPPPEALTACESAAEGDSCSFTSPRGEVSGQCFAPPKDGAALACKPADR